MGLSLAWPGLKVVLFYAVPVAAVVLALLLLAVLVQRVRGGRLPARRAALLFLWAWLAGPAVLLLITLNAEVAGHAASTVTAYRWDAMRLLDLLSALLPIAAAVCAVVLGLHLLLVAGLLLSGHQRKPPPLRVGRGRGMSAPDDDAQPSAACPPVPAPGNGRGGEGDGGIAPTIPGKIRR